MAQAEFTDTVKVITPIAIGLIVLGIINKFFGDDDATKPPPPEKELPDSGSGIPEGWKADPLARKLYEAMEGVNFNPIPLNNALLELDKLPTADMFVAVYNRFNQAYGGGETLREWIFHWSHTPGIPDPLENAIKKRMDELQLSGILPIGVKPLSKSLSNSINCVNSDIAVVSQCF